ncbi:hypothetical protein BP5796_08193 [Coleophoma crateriformis]|uniref:Uncharacterized protein n=1 Tax=Coleophoma crateriformis TaxID=565419 RepID=A0A3D8RDN4_9HELO|nr:hypothetical protein BP5796_08193 [Coleophoma crateriformis]
MQQDRPRPPQTLPRTCAARPAVIGWRGRGAAPLPPNRLHKASSTDLVRRAQSTSHQSALQNSDGDGRRADLAGSRSHVMRAGSASPGRHGLWIGVRGLCDRESGCVVCAWENSWADLDAGWRLTHGLGTWVA